MTQTTIPDGKLYTRTPMWLVYEDSEGTNHYQDHSLVVDQGTLVDPHTGEDMDVIGFVTELPDPTRKCLETVISHMEKCNALNMAQHEEKEQAMSRDERIENAYARGLSQGYNMATTRAIERLHGVMDGRSFV